MNFIFSRRVQFYETDAMGIVHHAKYLHFFEEARLELLRHMGHLENASLEEINFPVLESQVIYKKPLSFDDIIDIHVDFTTDQLRLYFDYKIRTKRYPEAVAFGKTVHIALDMRTRKPIRLPERLKNIK